MGLARVLDPYGLTPGERATDPSCSPLRYPATVVLLLCLFGVMALALAKQPDPMWIAGVYDGADLDDAIALITDTPIAGDSHPPVSRLGSGGLWCTFSRPASPPSDRSLLGPHLRSPPIR